MPIGNANENDIFGKNNTNKVPFDAFRGRLPCVQNATSRLLKCEQANMHRTYNLKINPAFTYNQHQEGQESSFTTLKAGQSAHPNRLL
jgi:hypothetical protein